MENSPYMSALNRLRKNKTASFSFIFLSIMVLLAVFAPLFSPYKYYEQDLSYGAKPPSDRHWLGTDDLGRDLFTRMLYGARVSLLVGFLATMVSLCIGVTYGAVSGFSGSRTDNIMMRFVDILYGLPFMFFVIILMVVAGRNLINLFLALGAVQWLTTARIVRGQVLSLKEREFVQAAVALGAGKWRIIFHHILPNLLGPVIVYATLTIPAVILEESFLSFLGLGVQPPLASWGSLIRDGVEALGVHWWRLAFPSLTLSLTLLALNFLGDGLRDSF